MGDAGMDGDGASLLELLGRHDHSTARVGHVVDQDGHLATHIAHQRHAGYFVGLLPLLVDQREVRVEAVRNGCYATGRCGSKCWGLLANKVVRNRRKGTPRVS